MRGLTVNRETPTCLLEGKPPDELQFNVLLFRGLDPTVNNESTVNEGKL